MPAEPGKSTVEDVLPLSPTQQGMVFHALFDEQAPDVYTGQLTLSLDGPLDAARFRAAAEALLRRHANLRAEFRTLSSGKVTQVVRREVALPWRETDLSDRPDEFEALLAEDRALRFDLVKPPLLRFTLVKLGDERHRLVLSSHHLLWDGWSAPILVRELFTLYATGGAPLPRVRPYRDYLKWLSEQDSAAAEKAWSEALSDLDGPTLVGQPHPESGVPERFTTTLDAETTAKLTSLARERGLTPSTVLQGLWALLLSGLTGRTDVVLGATVSGRPPGLAGVESMVGLFINTLPVRVTLRADESLEDLLKRLQREQSVLLDHQHAGLADIQRVSGHSTLFDTLIVFESYPLDLSEIEQALGADGPRLTGIDVHDAAHYPLSLTVIPGERLGWTFGYQPAVFDEAGVSGIADRLKRLVEVFTDAPATPVARISPENTAEAGPIAAVPRNVRALFEAQVARTPDATAVVFGDTKLTYAELDARANRVASALGAGPETVVALALPRSADFAIALIGVLKSGAAYLPIDISYPAERIDLMLTDAKPAVVIRDLGQFDAEPGPLPDIAPEHPAYVIFTSGSTGRPKAVVGTQLALANRLTWSRDFLPRHEVRVAKSPLSFIDGTTELLGGLIAGETVVIADAETAGDVLALTELIDRERVNLVTVVPSLLAGLVEAEGSFASVETWVTSGEALTEELARKVAERWPDARLINLYGCSEAAGDSLAADSVLIGHPVANTTAYILDAFLRPSEIGELYLAGAGLARGYLGQPGRTAERFVANPFGTGRLYRTGDLVRRTERGLEFLGRADHQVKIRGFRVEPGEVEAALRALDGVSRAVVVPRDGKLAAYVVATRDGLELRREMAQAVPGHLVPAVVVVLGELPLTPSGKVDRTALPAPDFAELTTSEGPRDDREKVLCGLFAEVLGLAEVGIHDSFFELGGDSVISVRLVARARGAGITIAPRDVFEHETVAELARNSGDVAPQAREFTPGNTPLVSLSQEQLAKVSARWQA
ncbi:amino acid adenylation domain-containing protein [Amycolatopsis sp. NPDC059657]|uniref:amino acid adenylation domain-containing protein n=1 Tax=Amycolatopsis sp. NPDC059657 TaxID=3346899 RepID=UPI00366F228E